MTRSAGDAVRATLVRWEARGAVRRVGGAVLVADRGELVAWVRECLAREV